jgi:hypothetical protein
MFHRLSSSSQTPSSKKNHQRKIITFLIINGFEQWHFDKFCQFPYLESEYFKETETKKKRETKIIRCIGDQNRNKSSTGEEGVEWNGQVKREERR